MSGVQQRATIILWKSIAILNSYALLSIVINLGHMEIWLIKAKKLKRLHASCPLVSLGGDGIVAGTDYPGGFVDGVRYSCTFNSGNSGQALATDACGGRRPSQVIITFRSWDMITVKVKTVWQKTRSFREINDCVTVKSQSQFFHLWKLVMPVWHRLK